MAHGHRLVRPTVHLAGEPDRCERGPDLYEGKEQGEDAKLGRSKRSGEEEVAEGVADAAEAEGYGGAQGRRFVKLAERQRTVLKRNTAESLQSHMDRYRIYGVRKENRRP